MTRDLPKIVPDKTRYVPLQQQPYSCCATCIQMVCIRRGLPLLPAELIGWHLGLVIPPEDAHFFYNPRISEKPPPKGYGTQVGIEGQGIDTDLAFQNLGLPLKLEIMEYRNFDKTEDIWSAIEANLAADNDVIMSVLWGDVVNTREIQEPYDPDSLHIILVDYIDDDYIRFVDPARGPKWRLFHKDYISRSMEKNKERASSGIWIIKDA